jgi:hypothetical protein
MRTRPPRTHAQRPAPAAAAPALSAFSPATAGGTAEAIKANGTIAPSGQADVGAGTTALGAGSPSGFTLEPASGAVAPVTADAGAGKP